MEAFPPSYTEATTSTRNHWPLVAPYLTKYELLATSLVCRNWHELFAGQLWGNPSSHFDSSPRRSDDEPQPFDLNSFRRCVKIASQKTRAFVHTLRIIPSVANAASGGGTYGITSAGLPAAWLRDLVAQLPRLQSLILRGVDQVDATALQAFSRTAKDDEEEGVSRQNLSPGLGAHIKLLDVSNCNQATAKGLAILLRRLENLLWLDLSRTPAARDTAVLDSLRHLRSLKVLKLRGCKLGDDRVKRLAAAIGRRVRWLDLEDNNMIGGSSSLVERCMGNPAAARVIDGQAPPAYSQVSSKRQGKRRESPPPVFEADMYRSLTSGTAQHLAIEDEADIGISHLRLSFAYQPSHPVASALFFGSNTLEYLDMGATAIDFHPSQIRQQRQSCSVKHVRASWNAVTSLALANASSQDPSSFSRLFPRLETLVLITEPSYAGSGTSGYANGHNATTAIINLIRTLAASQSPKPPLQKLVLEVAARPANARLQYPASSRINSFFRPTRPVGESASQGQRSRGWNYSSSTKAVTGDADSEKLWHYAAEKDFSFFDEEGEEVGSVAEAGPSQSRRPPAGLTAEGAAIDRVAGGIGEDRPTTLPAYAPQHSVIDKIAGGKSRQEQLNGPLPPPYDGQPQQGEVDIVKEVAAHRAKARQAYQETLRQQDEKRLPPEAAEEIAARLGYWDGVVGVVRV